MNTTKARSRIYKLGRPTTGWARGKQITDASQVRPGDVLIAVSHQFKAVNLVQVRDRGDREFPVGFDFEYVDCRTLQHSDGLTMFCHNFELAGPQHIYYRAIDRRSSHRRIRDLPAWLRYPKRSKRCPQASKQ